jgi:hypothetical protein
MTSFELGDVDNLWVLGRRDGQPVDDQHDRRKARLVPVDGLFTRSPPTDFE